MPLPSEDRALLDRLCASAVAGRAPLLSRAERQALGRLRMKGLVAWSGYEPSPSALADFVDRQSDARDTRRPLWSPAEDDRLRRAYAAGERIDRVATELGRTPKAALTRAAKILKIAGTHAAGRGGFATEPDWTEAEDESLKADYGKISTQALADAFGRSKSSVYNRAFRLGLKHGAIERWSADENRAVRIAFDRGISLADLVAALGRNYYAVAKRVENKGYRFGARPRLVTQLSLEQILALEDPAISLPLQARRLPPTKVRQPEEWPETRKASFLEALERTGRLDEALKAIGLATSSRKVPYRLKSRDPAFSQAWDEALRRSSYRPGRKPGLRARIWDSAERQEAFVAAVRRLGQLKAAYAAIGLAGNCARDLKAARARDPEFDRRCREAIAEGAPAPKPRQKLVRPTKRPSTARRAVQAEARAAAPPPMPAKAPPPPPPPMPQRPARKVGGVQARTGAYNGFHFAAADASPRVRPAKSDAEICAETLRYLEERKRMQALADRPVLTLTEAKLRLQRRGRIVFRSSLDGGRPDRWCVSGMGREVTDDQLIEAAARLPA